MLNEISCVKICIWSTVAPECFARGNNNFALISFCTRSLEFNFSKSICILYIYIYVYMLDV